MMMHLVGVFPKNLRLFNMIVTMTSLGGNVDRSIPKGKGPNMFRL